ncbi:hypothetical protein DZ860_03270 [Vibrio sinensis]|uniref:Uncharacterized protein n=1 Tax=Vibrio sinensis TaxID=2302434 RepID=A0A3A6R433_9VIBR|nr:hypothetical protein [Vibrio sinensis]RJX75709.1 hypothetical protein DZ860_03270 [Vibrio sinensis]
MGFHSDYEEVLSVLHKVGPLQKVLLVLFLFMQISAIASLSETFFKWKGFILDAVSTYQDYLVSPLIMYSELIGLHYQEHEVHSAVILSTMVVLGMRLLMLGQLSAFKKISEDSGNEIQPQLTYFKFMSIFFPVSLWLAYGLTDSEIRLMPQVGMLLIYPVFLVGPKVILHLFGSENSYLEKGRFSYFKTYYAYLLAIAVVIGILGAINSGLTRIT